MVEPHLRIYKNRSELVGDNGKSVIFYEGKPDINAKKRNKTLKDALSNGWFRNFVNDTIHNPSTGIDIQDGHRILIEALIASITSEVGRAIVGLTVLQMVTKAIEPEQSIRLHKGGNADFSWVDGITMRTLDANYIEPVLREFGLLYVNKYGVFMTRSLAENYPYTQFYKAAIRGGKEYWLAITDEIEEGLLDCNIGLKYIISLLSNRSDEFKKMAEEALVLTDKYLKNVDDVDEIFNFINSHIIESSYSARVFEIALHSLIQVVQEIGYLDGHLLPLCQMRTANKKHRNIGDIEIVVNELNNRVVEAYDAKYGKPYLRDELEELNDKLVSYGPVQLIVFVTNEKPDITNDIQLRINELQEIHETNIKIFSFKEWTNFWLDRIENDNLLITKRWLKIYVESLCQKRREYAPIDEPSEEWVLSLMTKLRQCTA